MENSWLNAEYGGPLKSWLLNNFTLEYILESLKERWFEDAAIITNIVIAEKTQSEDYTTKFIYLKKRLKELFGAPPSASDFVANQRYYENIVNLFSTAKKVEPTNGFFVYEDETVRIVSVKKSLLEEIEKELGKWGIIKGPKKYLETIIKFLKKEDMGLKMLNDIVAIDRGLTTNANEIFYLPSKHWQFRDEDEQFLTLKGPSYKSLKVSKKYLRPLIRPAHIEESPYAVSKLSKEKNEDYVLWVDDLSKVKDSGMIKYLAWAADFVKKQNEMDGDKFPTLAKFVESPSWTELPDKSGAKLFCKNDIYKNFAIYMNNISVAQVDKRLFLASPKVDVDARILFGTMNSIFTYLGMELIGRTNLGEGALDVNVVDYKKIPIIDPQMVRQRLERNGHLQDFLQIIDKMLNMKPHEIEFEAKNEIRLKMEEHILGAVGFSKKDITEFYDDLITLVNLRAERATSTKGKTIR